MFSIYVAGFVVGAVLVCQPHILTKALYVKSDRQVRQYLAIFTVIFMLFFLRAHVVLVVIAVAAFLINLHPPRLLGVFGQVGVYGLAAAPPLLMAVLHDRVPLALAWPGSAAALTIHFVLFFHGTALFPESTLTFANPGVTAAIAALVTIPPMLIIGRISPGTVAVRKAWPAAKYAPVEFHRTRESRPNCDGLR